MTEFDLRQEAVFITVISQCNIPESLTGLKMFISIEGKKGNLCLPWLEEKANELAYNCLANGMFMVTTVTNPAQPEQTVTVMIEPYLPPHELIILGGGHIAVPLTGIGKLMGYRVVVVDDRPEFVSLKRFPEADKGIYCSFNDIEDVLDLGPRSCVIIVTRGHKHDLDCLRRVIKYPLAYLGMVGSRRKVHLIRKKLSEEGVQFEKIDQVHMPIGLDIGAKTPVEIAVSIAAELINVRRGGRAHSIKTGVSNKVQIASECEMPSAIDQEIFQKAIKAAIDDAPAALATVIKTQGSTPRKAGARMLIDSNGCTFGTIGGGFGESEVGVAALNVIKGIKPYIYRLSLDSEAAASEGMVCGGMMEVFIEPVSAFARIFSGGVDFEPEYATDHYQGSRGSCYGYSLPSS